MNSPLMRSASPLTVLFAPAHVLIDEAQEGSEYHWSYKLIERLALDHGVRIIALTVQARVESRIPGVEFVSVDPGGPLPMSNLERLRFHLQVYSTARRILDSVSQVDVIHHMLPFGCRSTFNLLTLLRRRSDPPVVIGPLQPPQSFTSRDELRVAVREFSATVSPPLPHRRARPPLSTFVTMPVLSRLSGQTLRRSAALVAISERSARIYHALSPSSYLTVIPPGIDTEQFTPRPSREHSSGAEASDTEGRQPLQILAVGYLTQRKAIDTLITAVAKLAQGSMPVSLRIVGDGPLRPYLEDLAHHLGIGNIVTFAGLVPHSSIMREYRAADILCSPSLSEGFATVSLEALACGLPIVATPTGGFRDVLTQREVGILVPFGAVDELAHALAQLGSDRLLREHMSRQARQLAVQEYDWRVIAGRYLSLYEQIAQEVRTEV